MARPAATKATTQWRWNRKRLDRQFIAERYQGPGRIQSRIQWLTRRGSLKETVQRLMSPEFQAPRKGRVRMASIAFDRNTGIFFGGPLLKWEGECECVR